MMIRFAAITAIRGRHRTDHQGDPARCPTRPCRRLGHRPAGQGETPCRMSSPRGSLPCHTSAAPLPIRVRPVHGECAGSYLIRMATGNRCPPRTMLQLLGRVHHRSRPNQWVELHPRSTITLNTAALHRLAAYSDIPTAHLLRALPELDHEHSSGEPIVRVSPPNRAFLRSCPDCERRAGGAALTPDRHRLQLVCARHGIWLVNADPPLSTGLFPEVRRAARALRRQQHRHQDNVSALYRVVRECLTNDWRGLGWHTHLAKRWEARQQILRPDTPGKDRYLLARTEHWSMLPEAAAVITVLANDYYHAIAPTITGPRHLTRALSRALKLESYWSTAPGDHFDAHHTFMPLRTAHRRTNPHRGATRNRTLAISPASRPQRVDPDDETLTSTVTRGQRNACQNHDRNAFPTPRFLWHGTRLSRAREGATCARFLAPGRHLRPEVGTALSVPCCRVSFVITTVPRSAQGAIHPHPRRRRCRRTSCSPMPRLVAAGCRCGWRRPGTSRLSCPSRRGGFLGIEVSGTCRVGGGRRRPGAMWFTSRGWSGTT